jgi:hypothetical protein
MSRIVIVIIIYHRHKPIDSINLLVSIVLCYKCARQLYYKLHMATNMLVPQSLFFLNFILNAISSRFVHGPVRELH